MADLYKRIKNGFTLVELLVVIAIIGILVALIMPQITDAMTRGRLTAMAANGRNIVQQMIQHETGETITFRPPIWPRERGGYSDGRDGRFPHSTRVFWHLMERRVLSFAPSFFSGPGVPSAGSMDEFIGTGGDAERVGAYNAWCIIVGVSPMTPENLPVVFTRNLSRDHQNFTQLRQRFATAGVDDEEELLDGVFENRDPFQEIGFVFVNKGGAAFPMFRQDLHTATLTNVFQLGEADNEILRPGPEF